MRMPRVPGMHAGLQCHQSALDAEKISHHWSRSKELYKNQKQREEGPEKELRGNDGKKKLGEQGRDERCWEVIFDLK